MKLPESITYQISKRAVEIATEIAPRDTGSGVSSFEAISSEGLVGIRMPNYMVVQNYGAKPRLMYELAGKVIPIRTPSGQIVFRTATYNNIGRRRITARDEKGRIITTKISWKHPGITGSHFGETAIQRAFNEWSRSATSSEVTRILEESEVSFLIEAIKELR